MKVPALAYGVPHRPRAVVGLVLDDEVWSREGALLDLDTGRAGVSVLYLQQSGVEGESKVKPVEIGHVFDHDVHADGIADLDFGCRGIKAHLGFPLRQPHHGQIARPQTQQGHAHQEQKCPPRQVILLFPQGVFHNVYRSQAEAEPEGDSGPASISNY